MTDEQRTVRLFETWLESEAPVATPAGLLDRIDTATRSARPRPGWVARLEGHHMDVIEGGRRTGVPRLGLVLAIIGLILAAVGVAAFIASQQPSVVVNPSPSPDASPNPSLTAEASLEPSLEPTPARVVAAGSLIEGRSKHAATILADGRVLIIGGQGPSETGENYVTSTEIWDPLTHSTVASGSLDPDQDFMARFSEAAILLPDGRVLAVPGDARGGSPLENPSAEVWDPGSGTWRRIETLTVPRAYRSATLLVDGRVLIAGGVLDPFHGDGATALAFIWDPIRETSTQTGSMLATRALHSATRLADGSVLLIGGNFVPGTLTEEPVSSAEIWDPETGTFSAVASLSGVRGTAITLGDGRVLVVGDSGAVLWDPRNESVVDAGSFSEPRMAYTATLLADGRVLIVGGNRYVSPNVPPEAALEVELWDPATLSFSVAGSLSGVRSEHTTTALPDGRAVIIGGAFGAFGGAPIQPIVVWEPARG